MHHGPLVFGDASWLWNEQQSRYLVWEFGIHFLDVLVHLLGPHTEIVHVLPILQPSIGHTTDLEVTIGFGDGALGRLEIVADSTRHSSFFSEIHVDGTAMDAFVRWFPPSLMLVSGQLSPLAALASEVKSVARLGGRIVSGHYLKDRNVSRLRLIRSYVHWLRGEGEFPLTIDDVLPTLRLLCDVESRVPSYGWRGPSREESVRAA